MDNIKIDPELRDLLPPLPGDKIAQLEQNIIDDGCRDPLVVWPAPEMTFDDPNNEGYETGTFRFNEADWNLPVAEDDEGHRSWGEDITDCDWDFTLIDGHHRYGICRKHGIPFDVVEREFATKEEAIIWMVDNQHGRRELSPYASCEVQFKKKEALARIAKANQGTRTDLLSELTESKNTRKELAKGAGLSTGTFAKAEIVAREAPEEVKEKLRNNQTSIDKEYQALRNKKKVEKREERAKREAEAAESGKLADVSLRCCGFDELIAEAEFDVVITDPPYPKEFVPLFGKLAEACAAKGVTRVAAMSGQLYLPEILTAMAEHLPYRWTMAYLTPGGQSVQIHPKKVNTFWKPILVFGDFGDRWLGDVAKSDVNDNDKDFHEWGQSASGMIDLVKRLSEPGETVCDPFMGAGTTAAACLATGRKFVGCDIDPDRVDVAERRLGCRK